MAREDGSQGIKNVVLVHGGFVDGSGWEGVYRILNEDGYNVTVVQNPTVSLADDASPVINPSVISRVRLDGSIW